MRVLHIIAGAATGGAETFAQDAVAALAERGIAAARDRPAASRSRLPATRRPALVFRRSGLPRWTGCGVARCARGRRRFGADIVHAWMARAASFVPRRNAMPGARLVRWLLRPEILPPGRLSWLV